MSIPEDATIIEVTAKDFETRYDATHTFPFFEDEGGDYICGYGHQDKAFFTRAANEYDTLCNGEPIDPPLEVESIAHLYAVMFQPAGADEDYQQFVWDGVTAETPGAFPLTLLSR